MIQYILECIAFQLVFLIIYDFLLKRETFFQWNRAYLIGTYALSLILPWVKIEAFKAAMPKRYYVYPEYLWGANDAAVVATNQSSYFHISWEQGLLFGGMILAALFFGYKMLQLYRLRSKGEIRYYKDFIKIVVANSNMAFSFFRFIFLGDRVVDEEHKNIIEHELVHIRQRHTYDLLFFEAMRIVGWFNPLVYVYQNRVSELHEFIADAHTAKADRDEQYELLLSQAFQTQNISFINQFFKTSLIKKRIVMLTKKKSKRIWQLKYLLLVPLVLGMLMYTSCETDATLNNEENDSYNQKDHQRITTEFKNMGNKEMHYLLKGYMDKMFIENEILSKEDYFKFKYLSYKVSSEPKIEVRNNDTLHFLGNDKTFSSPTDAEYEYYVSRTKAFQLVDYDLQVSLGKDLDIRKIEKEDNNLGPGEFISVADVRNLTGDELRKINRTIASTDLYRRFIYISDDDYAFLISKSRKGESKSANTRNPFANISPNDSIVPFSLVEEVPIFPGCEDAADPRACFQEKIQRHISKNFRYPDEAQKQGIQGRVSVMFTIDEQGNIVNIRKRGPDKLLEAETVRIIEKLPQMQPGKSEGKAVKVPFSIPITFKLEQAGFISHSENAKGHNAASQKTSLNYKLPKPLYMVDGKESSKTEIGFISPENIANIDVLKGELAQSRYGSKGKNGVIEISTKSGSQPSPESDMQTSQYRKNDIGGEETNISESGSDKVQISKYNYDANKKLVSGIVSDGSGLPLPGVNIAVQGSGQGVISNFDGAFEIKTEKGDVITFQYTGLKTAHLKIYKF